MDQTAVIEPQSNGPEPNPNNPSTSHSNWENRKRPVDNGDNDGDEGDNNKRRRCGGEMKRVVEIVLVLSAIGSIQGGGKMPCEAEVELMVEVRRKLVEMCEDLAPKDVVVRDLVVEVIEDLGLRSGGGGGKDQRLGGVCGSRLSIAERIGFWKRKMEESKKFLARTTSYTSQLSQENANASTAVGNRVGHISAVPTQQTSSDIKTTISSSGYNSSHSGRDSSSSALPTIDGAQFKVEGGTNGGTFYSSQLRVSSPANHSLVNAPPQSVHQPSASSTKFGPGSRKTNFGSVKVGAANSISMFSMTSQAARDQSISMNFGQALSPHNSHAEIAKTVQKLLQQNPPEHPSWAPPSRDYMNMVLTCQICKVATNEVDTVLVCDACDKGYHINCIKLVYQDGVPRGEWHCQKCLIHSNGKPLPPKYGRVTSTNTPKVPSITSSVQISQEKKVAAADSSVAQQKIKDSGNPCIQRPTGSDAAGMNHVESASNSKVLSASGGQLNKVSDKSVDFSRAYCDPAVGSSVARSIQHNQNLRLSINEIVSLSVTKSGVLANPLSPASSNEQSVDKIQIQNYAEESSVRNPGSNLTNRHQDGCYSTENIVSIRRSDIRRDDQVTSAAGSGPSDHSGLPSDGLLAVEWVGNAVQVVDGKFFYQSCCISGVIYKVHNYALFRFSPDKSTPSKLQAMWEDVKTGSKWLVVRKCYFPGDLPEIVGRPYTSGSNEVFESNQDSIVTPSFLQGQCEVLTAVKFEEEIVRRNQLAANSNSELKPIFLCKWFYDEVKGTFQPTSSWVMHIN